MKTKTTHMPGLQWSVWQHEDSGETGALYYVSDEFGKMVACQLKESDARLIASAPDLYFIAEIALRWFDAKAKDDNFKGSFPTSLLRAAVAKAEGK